MLINYLPFVVICNLCCLNIYFYQLYYSEHLFLPIILDYICTKNKFCIKLHINFVYKPCNNIPLYSHFYIYIICYNFYIYFFIWYLNQGFDFPLISLCTSSSYSSIQLKVVLLFSSLCVRPVSRLFIKFSAGLQ